jgi:hypothetical protein
MGGLDGWSEAEVEVDTVSTRCSSEAGRFSTVLSVSYIKGHILLMLVEVGSRSGLVNRGRSQEDGMYFERWERMTYLIIKN